MNSSEEIEVLTRRELENQRDSGRDFLLDVEGETAFDAQSHVGRDGR